MAIHARGRDRVEEVPICRRVAAAQRVPARGLGREGAASLLDRGALDRGNTRRRSSHNRPSVAWRRCGASIGPNMAARRGRRTPPVAPESSSVPRSDADVTIDATTDAVASVDNVPTSNAVSTAFIWYLDGSLETMTQPSSHAIADTDTRVEALQRRIAELTEAVAARDTFIAVAAHELRNPMTPIIGQVDLLLSAVRSGRCPPEQVEQRLERIQHSVRRYLKRAAILLDVSRLTSGRLQLEPEAFDLAGPARRGRRVRRCGPARGRPDHRRRAGEPVRHLGPPGRRADRGQPGPQRPQVWRPHARSRSPPRRAASRSASRSATTATASRPRTAADVPALRAGGRPGRAARRLRRRPMGRRPPRGGHGGHHRRGRCAGRRRPVHRDAAARTSKERHP